MKLVFAEVTAEVFAVVLAVVSVVVELETEDLLDQKLSAAFVGLFAFPPIGFITSGEVGALGEDDPAPLSTLRNKRRTGSGSDEVLVSVELARGGGWWTR